MNELEFEKENQMSDLENTLPVPSENNLPVTDWDVAARNILKRPPRVIKRLQFKKGVYRVGEKVIFEGTEFLAYWTEWRVGWVRWDDGKLTLGPTGRPADDFTVPDRPSKEKDVEGRFIWQLQNWLPMRNLETNELVVFTTTSAGGEIAIEEVTNAAAEQVDAGRNRGNPIASLIGNEVMVMKKYGDVPRPKFMVVAWENDRGVPATPVPTMSAFTPNDLDDEVPFF
jgi:hypothetical protein